MIGVVAAVLGFEDGGSLWHLATRIADLAPFRCTAGGVLGICGEPLHALIAVEAPGGAGSAPGHGLGERPARLERGPRRLREHADAIRQPDDPDRAGDYLGLGVVDLVWNRAFHRRAQDRAVEHVRHLHIDAIARAAVDLARQLHPRHVFADEAELARLLQCLWLDLRRLVRNFGKGGDFAIAEFAAGLGVHDRARLSGELFERDAKLLAGIVHEHAPHLRAEDA